MKKLILDLTLSEIASICIYTFRYNFGSSGIAFYNKPN